MVFYCFFFGVRKEIVVLIIKSNIKRISFFEWVFFGGWRESNGDFKGNWNCIGFISSFFSGKKNSESKFKEFVFSVEEGYVKMFFCGCFVIMYMFKD